MADDVYVKVNSNNPINRGNIIINSNHYQRGMIENNEDGIFEKLNNRYIKSYQLSHIFGNIEHFAANRLLMTDGAAVFSSLSLQYLSVASNSTLQTSSNTNFSIAGWFKLTDVLPAGLVTKVGTLVWEYGLHVSINKFAFSVSDNGTILSIVTVTDPTIRSSNVWYFVVAWYDGTNIRISVNNGSVISVAHTNGAFASNSTFRLGHDLLNLTYLDGTMDGVAFWKKALSADEITTLYNGGQGLAIKDFSGSLLTNLISGYDFDGPNNIVTDSYGTNTLTNNAGVTYDAGHIIGNILEDNNSISQWADISGLDDNIVQDVASIRPVYKILAQNDLPVIRFNGTNQRIANIRLLNQPCTVILAAKSNTNSNRRLFSGGDVSFDLIHTATTWQLNAGVTLDTGIISNTNYHIFTVLFNGLFSELWVDGIKGVTGNAGNNSPNGIILGSTHDGTNSLNGDLCEVIIYDRVLDHYSRRVIELYLHKKWSI